MAFENSTAGRPLSFSSARRLNKLAVGLGRSGREQHLDGFGIRFGLVRTRVAEADQLLRVGADIAREGADECANAKLADHCFGDVALANMGDLVRDDPGDFLGIFRLFERAPKRRCARRAMQRR